MNRKRMFVSFILVCGVGMGMAIFAYQNLYALHVMLRRGLSIWPVVALDDPRISPAMRLALSASPPPALPGDFAWQLIQPGFEVGELPALVGDKEVDRLFLARIDPKQFTFKVFNRPAGDKELDDWLQLMSVGLVMNGSYFGERGAPDTPVLSEGELLGPHTYEASHGAFIAKPGYADIRDLKNVDWKNAFAGMKNAMVSYPLLLASDGSSRAPQGTKWLANRTFVGKDKSGLIIVGTTKDAFFPLDRFARFLRDAPLDLDIALNLDGGPVACQGIKFPMYKRDFCGDWELKFEDSQPKLLSRLVGHRRWAMAVVLIAVPNYALEIR